MIDSILDLVSRIWKILDLLYLYSIFEANFLISAIIELLFPPFVIFEANLLISGIIELLFPPFVIFEVNLLISGIIGLLFPRGDVFLHFITNTYESACILAFFDMIIIHRRSIAEPFADGRLEVNCIFSQRILCLKVNYIKLTLYTFSINPKMVILFVSVRSYPYSGIPNKLNNCLKEFNAIIAKKMINS